MYKTISIKFLFFVILSFISYYILSGIHFLNLFDFDIIPFVSYKQVSVILLIIILVLYILSFAYKEKESVYNIVIRKCEYIFKFFLFFMDVLVWQRCSNEYCAIIIFETLLIYIIIEHEATKISKYRFKRNGSILSTHTEKPVIGRENLTKPQIEALDQLINVIENRTRNESVNIALIGEWGKGKSSIINTLIAESQGKNENISSFFFLKIDTQIFNGPQNIVEYVKNYFNCLFRRYGISLFAKNVGISYFSTLLDMLGGKETGFFSKLFDYNYNCFSDIEIERHLYSEKVEKLLRKSKRKNIVLIIDDADRGETKKQILKLLAEFSSIEGVICIVSLNESLRKSIKMIRSIEEQEDKGDNGDNFFDKYVHMEIKIKDSDKIEYENNIKLQIIEASKKILEYRKNKYYYVSCIESDKKRSIFDSGTDYGTNKINIGKTHITYGEWNMLTELFYYNLAKSDKDFGQYLEELIKNYFYNTIELAPHLHESEHGLQGIKNRLSLQICFGWGIFEEQSLFDFYAQIKGKSEQYFNIIWMLINAVDNIEEETDEFRKKVYDIDNLYTYQINKVFTQNGTVDTNVCNDIGIINNPEYMCVKEFLFSSKDENDIRIFLKNQNYDELKNLLIVKENRSVNFLMLTYLLYDFISYIRSVMNNYRLFKMQIREAELLGLAYLDYLINDWQPTLEIREKINDMKKHTEKYDSISYDWPNLKGFINTVLYSNYLTAFETRFVDGKLTDVKAWILYGAERNLLIITGKNDKLEIQESVFDTEGIEVQNISEAEKVQINEKVKILYSK